MTVGRGAIFIGFSLKAPQPDFCGKWDYIVYSFERTGAYTDFDICTVKSVKYCDLHTAIFQNLNDESPIFPKDPNPYKKGILTWGPNFFPS